MNIERKPRLCLGASTLLMAVGAYPAAAQSTNPATSLDPVPQASSDSDNNGSTLGRLFQFGIRTKF